MERLNKNLKKLEYNFVKELALIKNESMINSLAILKLGKLLADKKLITKTELNRLDRWMAKKLIKKRELIRKKEIRTRE